MKKYFFKGLLSVTLISSFAFTHRNPHDINENVRTAFSQSHPNADKVSWSEETGDYLVHFEQDGSQSVIRYDNTGTVLGTYRYFSNAAQLPVAIQADFAHRYPQAKLYGVTEISNGDQIVWSLKADNGKEWMTLLAESGGTMKVAERYNKQ